MVPLPTVVAVSTPFSLLLPVYRGDRADYLARAFQSTVQEQLVRPAEVVVVQDGWIGPELASALERAESSSPVPVRRLRLKHNVGLAQALQCGLSACAHEVVARMDADDISLPHRFAVQLPLIEAGADLVGAGMREFGEASPTGGVLRIPPTDPAVIATEARLRSPFNHPTVVYRREVVRAVGGYTDFALMEDYLLWAKMLVAGARVANVAEPLVRYRVGAGAYARRGGLAQLRAELRLQWKVRRIGFTTWAQFLRNVAVRGGYRLVPERVRRALYRKVIATYRG